MISRETKIEDIAKYFHKVMCSCGAVVGQYHNDGCDVARCRKCGDQAWISDCQKWKPDVWTGFWPGTIEAIENGWYSKWDGGKATFGDLNYTGRGWIECDGDDPEAGPDLNRVASQMIWDSALKRRVRRDIDLDEYALMYKEAGIKFGV